MHFQKLFHRINKNTQIFHILQMTFKTTKKYEKMYLRELASETTLNTRELVG